MFYSSHWLSLSNKPLVSDQKASFKESSLSLARISKNKCPNDVQNLLNVQEYKNRVTYQECGKNQR